MTAEVIAVVMAGYCEVCRRKLRDPLSIARRCGPTCWKKTHLAPIQGTMDFGKEKTIDDGADR